MRHRLGSRRIVQRAPKSRNELARIGKKKKQKKNLWMVCCGYDVRIRKCGAASVCVQLSELEKSLVRFVLRNRVGLSLLHSPHPTTRNGSVSLYSQVASILIFTQVECGQAKPKRRKNEKKKN